MLACLDRGSRTLLAVQAADRFGDQRPPRRPGGDRPRLRDQGPGGGEVGRRRLERARRHPGDRRRPRLDRLRPARRDRRRRPRDRHRRGPRRWRRARATRWSSTAASTGRCAELGRVSRSRWRSPAPCRRCCLRGPERVVIGAVSSARDVPDVVEADDALVGHAVVGAEPDLGRDAAAWTGVDGVDGHARQDRDRLGAASGPDRATAILGSSTQRVNGLAGPVARVSAAEAEPRDPVIGMLHQQPRRSRAAPGAGFVEGLAALDSR